MIIDVLTLFPKMFEGPLSESMLKRAAAKGAVTVRVHDLRDFSRDKHRKADDRPFGGGPGMVLSIQPIGDALTRLKRKGPRPFVVLLSASGRRFDQRSARRLSKRKRLVLVCGHYEGVDARIRRWIDEELSIGDYVLTGGELPAMVVIDCVVRLLPGVLGHEDSNREESFSAIGGSAFGGERGLLEYPQYTRPRVFRGLKVPEILFSGDHSRIAQWRLQKSLEKTLKARPDLIQKSQNSKVKSQKYK